MESSDCCCSGSDQVYKVEDSRGNPILILGQKTMGSGWNIYRSTPRNNNGAGDIPLGELNFSDSYSFDDCCKISCCSGTITPYTITVTFPKDLEVTSKAALFAVVQLMVYFTDELIYDLCIIELSSRYCLGISSLARG